MSDTIQTKSPSAAADTPQPAPGLAPEAVVEGLRTMRAQITEVTPLTAAQRKLLQKRRMPNPVLQASINAIGAADIVSLAVGQPSEEVRQMHEEYNRWTAAEDELRSMLAGIVGANLIRRQRVELAAARGYGVSRQLALDPAHAVLVPHVQEIKRLKSLARRKKGTQAPAPAPAPAPHAVMPEETSGT